MHAQISAIEYYLPNTRLTSADLSDEFPEWTAEKINSKTGIEARHLAGRDECASDLAFNAAQKLFQSGACQASDVDYLLLCTQSPDYFLPTTACLLQDRLGLSTSTAALDFNLGCSGFIYGLGLAQGIISSGQATRVLLITAETYSKYLAPKDKGARTIFGDAAAAVLLTGSGVETPLIGPFVYGTDGSGGPNLIVKAGGARAAYAPDSSDGDGNPDSSQHLFMDGAELFSFTLSAVPASIEALLAKAHHSLEEIDLFVFHQANKHMLEHLRKKLKIPEEKFCVSMAQSGNTVSSTIPIALKLALQNGRLRGGSLVMLAGFGVGYSWGVALLRWA